MKFEFAVIFIKTHRKRFKNNRLYLNTGVLSPVGSSKCSGAGTQSTTTILIIAGNAVFGGRILL